MILFTARDDLALKYVLSKDGKTITLSWKVPANVHEFIYTLDGDEHLIDGKRHFTFDGTKASVTLGRPQDGKPHKYGVEALSIITSDEVTV